MKNNMKPLLAIALLLILLFSFSGSALAREDALMPDACSHRNFYQLRSYYVYSANYNSCLQYYRVVCKCRNCGYTWNQDTLVNSLPHQRTLKDRGHGGSKHYYRYECCMCHYALTEDIPYTCYGPPCNVLPYSTIIQAK